MSPAVEHDQRASARGVLLLLALSALSLWAAPQLMPRGYSPLMHTTSESAAQGLQGAWLARLGFLAFGWAVIWLVALKGRVWARAVAWFHLCFGVLMTAAAAFSHRPWMGGAAFDPIEDALHSFSATGMGFAFALGTVARFLGREGGDRVGRALDGVAVVAAVLLPLLMLRQPLMAGLLQRSMFLIAYAWYGYEAHLVRRLSSTQ